ncbi:MAG: DUF3141 domain-containing protein [Burkholderiales bacterium]|nr:DUF3141 domain-containing protein [Burkholderiales bacterium]
MSQPQGNSWQFLNMFNLYTQQWHEYIADSSQRNLLFLNLMRERGNCVVERTQNNSSTVLKFDYEIIVDGITLPRPINYWLAKIIPPEGIITDPAKRPYVIQDPRAGQGPGIGGFKKDSEIGNAIYNSHPVYFIGFNADPVEKQTYEDIIKGQLFFYETVANLHPDSPKMCAIGNCAAGYLTMFSAMQRPGIFGPILIAGSPLSYWNGERGRYPMRYTGGLIGGSWINSLLGDLGWGKFDGTYLVLNFNLLNPANFLWEKQYHLYANIDSQSERYLQFEKWWGDFIVFNTAEIKWLVDKLFIGNQLTTGNLITSDGLRLDPRNITSPIITFVSRGDNISPPAQSAGWIADLYKDTDEIIARGKTIVYCLNQKVGHLAIFTATKVGKRENQLFVENMDTIDILPPGLYELVIDTPEGMEERGFLQSHYASRTIDDIKALGYNTTEDDRAFATVAQASEAFNYIYEKIVHPWFKIYASPALASYLKHFRPLRLSYSLFSDRVNPLMKLLIAPAQKAQQNRVNLDKNNIFWHIQEESSNLITTVLYNYTTFRDNLQEQVFFAIWSNPWVQKFWNTDKNQPRHTPSTTQFDREELIEKYVEEVKKHLKVQSSIEAFFRFIALIQIRRHKLHEFVIRKLVKQAREIEPTWKERDIHQVIKSQAMVVRHDKDAALKELKNFTDHEHNAQELAKNIMAVASQTDGLPEDVFQIAQEITTYLLQK